MVTNEIQDENSRNSSPAYSRDIIEFVTVAVEFCSFLENAYEKCQDDREAFTDTLLKIMPLLYLKAALMPKYEILDDYDAEDFVTEDNYNIVWRNIGCVMGDKDDYLDVFVEDMKYSDSPILCTVSEGLADIYQELKNFAMRYKNAIDEQQMMNALAICKEEFQYSWGQKLVNLMRALHEVRYSEVDEY